MALTKPTSSVKTKPSVASVLAFRHSAALPSFASLYFSTVHRILHYSLHLLSLPFLLPDILRRLAILCVAYFFPLPFSLFDGVCMCVSVYVCVCARARVLGVCVLTLVHERERQKYTERKK